MVIVMKRKIMNKLLDWKNDANNKPLMVLGARQVGKTYIIQEFCKNEFQNYISVNLLEDNKIVDLYNSNQNSSEKFMKLKVLYSDKSLVNKILMYELSEIL